MQVNNNLNSMIQLEKRLEESANALAKLNKNNNENNSENKKQLSSEEKPNNNLRDSDIVQEIVQQIEIPIAYNANAEVISTQNSISRTLLDIKA